MITPPNAESLSRMTSFDSLPKPLRVAIAGAAFPCEPKEMADRLAIGRSPERIVRGIIEYGRRRRS